MHYNPSARVMMRPAALLFILFLVVAVQTAGPECAWGKLITATKLPSPFEKDPPFGEIVREIRVEGNKHTRTNVILDTFKSKVGYPYTQTDAKKDFLWIMRLGAFTSVAFTTKPISDGIILTVTVTEATPYVPSLSIELTQANGLSIGPAVSSSNLLGMAARASVYARFGGTTNIGIQYADPQLGLSTWKSGYSFYYFHRERDNVLLDFGETSNEFFFELKRTTSDYTRTGIRFHYLGLGSNEPDITLNPDNYDKIPGLGIFVQNDSRNSFYPTNGWYMDLEAGKYGIFGGDGDYWRLVMDVRRYMRLPRLGKRHSLAVTTYLSALSGVVGETIPIYEQAFIGGTNSVRGWELGSRVGQNQWLNTVEYWYRLMEERKWKFWFLKWLMGFQIAAFGDFGTAWTEPEQLEGNMIGGGGVGFRLTLPVITMLRLDLGYGQDGLGVALYVGGKEKADAEKFRVR